MYRRKEPLHCRLTVLIALGLVLGGADAAQAGTTYKIQPIIKVGDTVGDVAIKVGTAWDVGTLNDNGALVFIAADGPDGPVLFRYSDGQLTPIVVAGREGPAGIWNKDGSISTPVSMNRQGNIVFAAGILVGGAPDRGTFRWDAQTHQITPVALAGMPAANNLTYVLAAGSCPVINNNDEIAIVGSVKNASGKVRVSIFFLGRDGKVLPVAIPDMPLPGPDTLQAAQEPALNDAGVIGFRGTQVSLKLDSGYFWEQGAVTLIAQVGADAPGGGKFAQIRDVRPNDLNRDLLVGARINDAKTGPEALFLSRDGQLVPAAVPGQEMPGGGKLKSVRTADDGVSPANDKGQRAFLAVMDDGGTAAYVMDADGKLSLVLKSGTTTELGTITVIGPGATGRSTGIGFNSKGQVALTVSIDNGVDTLVLLTPVAE